MKNVPNNREPTSRHENDSYKSLFSILLLFVGLFVCCAMLTGCAGLIKQTYKVHVLDQSGDPVSGALVVLHDASWVQYPYTYYSLKGGCISLFHDYDMIAWLDKNEKYPYFRVEVTDADGIAHIKMRKAVWGTSVAGPELNSFGMVGYYSAVFGTDVVAVTNNLNYVFDASAAKLMTSKLRMALTFKENQKPEIFEYKKRIEARLAELKDKEARSSKGSGSVRDLDQIQK
jgi:hypothetical protein